MSVRRLPSVDALVNVRKLDFEIDFYERILSRDPSYAEVLVNPRRLIRPQRMSPPRLAGRSQARATASANATVYYNLACSHALLSHMTEALSALEVAIDLGYDDLDHLLSDPDLAAIRRHVGFRRVLAKLEAACAPTRLV